MVLLWLSDHSFRSIFHKKQLRF